MTAQPADSGRLSDASLTEVYEVVLEQDRPVDWYKVAEALRELRTWRAFESEGIEFTHVTGMPGQPAYWIAFKREPEGHTLQEKSFEGHTIWEAGKAALAGLGLKP